VTGARKPSRRRREEQVAGLRRDAEAIFMAGVRAVEGSALVRKAVRAGRSELRLAGERILLSRVERIVVVGGGKAGVSMARGLLAALGPELMEAKRLEGWVNVPGPVKGSGGRIHVHPARHTHENQPTAAGVAGVRRMLEMVSGLGSGDLVICLLSGGGSALLPLPAGLVTLADKQRVTALLMNAGATIREMNAVRKHLSGIKGGGLVRATSARVVSLIVSDVVGDPLDVIASGPTAPDPTTYADALAVLERHSLLARAPVRVVEHLRRGVAGEYDETWKGKGRKVLNVVIGNNRTTLAAAAVEARRRGYRVQNLGGFLEGESRELGILLAGLARGMRDEGKPVRPPVCILSGGETTVTLGWPHGKGGRNQELVLAALAHLWEDGMRRIGVLSGGTDGEDGPTDAAGAVADAALLGRAKKKGQEPRGFLARHDAYTWFESVGGLLRTGPTGTNVMDLRVVLVGR
jgi:glycerate-2-kinase